MKTPISFIAGETYKTRSVGDLDCIISVTVEKRTAKTLTAKTLGKVKIFRILVHEGVETIKPWGSYSMCPVLKAG